ncbi:MAG: hypothetical protein II336_03430 [Loktanella sp.]|nr:hypothetical protein [Loktanella sp.]
MSDIDIDHTADRASAQARLQTARKTYDAALHDYLAALQAFESVFEHPFKPTDKRTLRLSKIEMDSELRAFIEARIDSLTLQQIVSDIADAFKPDRHVSVSTLNRWDLKRRSIRSARRAPSSIESS